MDSVGSPVAFQGDYPITVTSWLNSLIRRGVSMDSVRPSVAFQGVYSSPGTPFPTRDSSNSDPPHQSAPHGLVSVSSSRKRFGWHCCSNPQSGAGGFAALWFTRREDPDQGLFAGRWGAFPRPVSRYLYVGSGRRVHGSVLMLLVVLEIFFGVTTLFFAIMSIFDMFHFIFPSANLQPLHITI